MDVRAPVVAGYFYPASPARLEGLVRRFLGEQTGEAGKHRLLAAVSPHAGYVYSGPVAGSLFAHLELPRRVILLGPNHTGLGDPVSVAPHSFWSTPLGKVKVSEDLRARFLELVPAATLDAGAHVREHSIEVQIPFIQVLRSDVEVLPVCLSHLGLQDCLELGEALAQILEEGDVGVIASSDMTHYEPDDEARRKDKLAIDAMLSGDPASLYETVRTHRISMCGFVPATVAMAAAAMISWRGEPHLVGYATSGDVSGDRSAVVGYAAVCLPAELEVRGEKG